MSVLDRKLRRDLLGARATLLAILMVIVVGIACFVGLGSAYSNLERSRLAYYAQCRMADFSIELKKAPLTAVKRLAEWPGVAEVRPRIVFDAVIDLNHVAKPLNGQVISLPDAPRPIINGIVLRRGSYFTGNRLAEVIVNDAFARERGIHPGQTLHIILNNRRQRLFVVGTAISSEFVYLINPGSIVPDPKNYGIFYVKESFAAEALDFDGACNQIVGLLAPEVRDRPQPVLDDIEHRLSAYGVFAATPQSRQASHRFLSDEIAGLRVTAGILPTIFLGVGALILNILMMRLAEQQRTTIGTLKAVGYTNRSLAWHYLKFGVLVGIVGGVVGVGLGHLFAQGMIVVYRRYFEFPRLENRVVPLVFLGALVISVVFSALGTLRGIRSIMRLDPAEAMRARPPAGGGAIALERARWLWRRLGFRWQMVARSVWRNKWRTIVGMLSAALGSALMLLAFYFNNSMDYLISFQFEKVVLSDFDLMFKGERDAGALLEAKRLPGVDDAEPLLHVPCEIRHGHRARKAAITGILPGATLTVPRDAAGHRLLIPERGLLMSRKLADILGVSSPDDVTIVPIKGRREPKVVPVVRTTDAFLGMATYANLGYLNALIDEEEAVSSVQLKATSSPARRLALYHALKELPAVQAISDNDETKETLVRMLLDTMKISITALIAFAAAIYFGSILTTSLVAIAERRRDVATLLVIGYEKRQVGGIFLRESLVVNTIGSLLGLPLGLWLILVIIEQYETEVYRMPLVLEPTSFVLTIGLGVAFTILAQGLVQRAVNRLDWLEALNARE
ncbi:MAG: ABC transporter permease [Planctomycetota bacterium]